MPGHMGRRLCEEENVSLLTTPPSLLPFLSPYNNYLLNHQDTKPSALWYIFNDVEPGIPIIRQTVLRQVTPSAAVATCGRAASFYSALLWFLDEWIGTFEVGPVRSTSQSHSDVINLVEWRSTGLDSTGDRSLDMGVLSLSSGPHMALPKERVSVETNRSYCHGNAPPLATVLNSLKHQTKIRQGSLHIDGRSLCN